MLFLASVRTTKRKYIRKNYVLLAALPILVKQRAEPGYNKTEKRDNLGRRGKNTEMGANIGENKNG